MINPATGYTIYSPFQDPYSQACPFPCLYEDIPAHEVCPWHKHCCRAEMIEICQSSNHSMCKQWTRYHHFCETPEGRDSHFLREYLKYDPSFLLFSAHFFKSGAELALANRYYNQVQRRLQQINNNGPNLSARGEMLALQSQLAYFAGVKTHGVEVLGQFALYWDAQAAQGLFPARPGRERIPELNVTILEDSHLRAATWAKNDDSLVPWPYNIKPWSNFAELLPFPGNPSLISWSSSPPGNENEVNFGGRYGGSSGASKTLGTAVLQQQPDARFPLQSIDPQLLQQWLSGQVSQVYPEDSQYVVAMDLDLPSSTLPQQQQHLHLHHHLKEQSGDESTADTGSSVAPVRPYPVRVSTLSQPNKETRKASSIEKKSSPLSSLSSSLSPLPGSPDLDSDSEFHEEDTEEVEQDVEYPVEALIGHKPKRASRHSVTHYRVRWEGDWPLLQKETWEHRSNIAPNIIREYWLQYERTNGPRRKVGRPRKRALTE